MPGMVPGPPMGAIPADAIPPGSMQGMPGAIPGAMPGAMPGTIPGAIPGGMPAAMPGMLPGMVVGNMPPVAGSPPRPAGGPELQRDEELPSLLGPPVSDENPEHDESVSRVPPDYEVDHDARYSGTVDFYSKLKGYGFIEVGDKGALPEDRIFVQWRNIDSKDRFPFLVKGLEVEFGIMKWRDSSRRGQVSLRAKNVTLPDGASVHLQDEIDAAKKQFIGSQEGRYTGNMKFFNPKAGYGYITVDPGFVVEGVSIPTELRVERSEVNAGGKQPQWMQNLAVEFGIWMTSRGVPKAYNVTLPGGAALTQSALENRQALGGQTYRGEVQMWNWKQGWGFIKADASVALPPHVQAKLTQQTQTAQQKAASKGRTGSDEELLYVRRSDIAPGVKLQKGSQVMFQIYVDDKGVGAFEVQTI